MKPTRLVLLVTVFYALHQDVWFWRAARPLVFGFLPIGLCYHACYSVAAAGVLWLLVRSAWPGYLETRGQGDAETGREDLGGADGGGFAGDS